MEHHICCLISKQDLLGVFRTIYLFLENQNFQETCRALRKECHTFGCSLPDIVSGNIRVLKPNLFAQNTITLNENCESFILESNYANFKNNYNNNYKRCGSGKPDCATTLVITSRNTQKNEYEALQSNFNHLRDEYKRLIAVTTELTSALENNIKGQTKNYHLVLDHCKSIYPSLFIESLSDSRGIPSLISPKYKETVFEEEKPKDREIVIKINSDAVNITSNVDEAKPQERSFIFNSQNQFDESNFKIVHDDDSFSVMFADAEDDVHEECNFIKPKGQRNDIDVICESRDMKSDFDSTEFASEDCEKTVEEATVDCTSCRQEVEKILDTLIVNATKSPNDSKMSVNRHKSDEVINDVQSKEIIFERKPNLGLNTKSSCILTPVNEPERKSEKKSPISRDRSNQESRTGMEEIERIVPIVKSNSLEATNLQQRYREITPRYQGNNFSCGDRTVNGLNFDYNKLKYDLVHGRVEWKLKLMQALRLQLIRADTNEKRDALLTEYIDHDILNIKYAENSLSKIYFASQETGYRMLLEGFSRLINTFSCFKKGRDYLTIERHFLDSLLEVKIFEVKLFSSYTRDMLVATLQKLSLRKPIRKQMIEAGVMANVVDFLNNYYNKVSEYCLEYACALLMNLSLERQGRDILAMRPFILVSLLKKLLVYNVCCLPYVNGTLYSVLAHEEINQVARVQDLDKAIIQKIQNSGDKQLNFQLELILNYRFNDEFTNFGYESDTDEREEVDLLEDEINDGDVFLCEREEDVLDNYKIVSHKGEEMKTKIFRPLTPASVKMGRSSVERLELNPPNPAKMSKSFADNSSNLSHPLSSRIKSTTSQIQPTSNGISSMPSTVRSKTKLIKSSSAKRKKSKYVNHNYQSSICYMDTPCKLTQDGENKYQCSCYEVIKNEVGFHQKIEQANSIVVTKSSNNISSVCESLVSEEKNFDSGLQGSLQTKLNNFYGSGRLHR